MKITREVNSVYMFGTVVGSGGTHTATGVSWSDTYEANARMVASIGAAATGTVVCTLQQSDALATGYTDVGTISTGGAGTAVFEYYAPSITGRYLRTVITSTGGTALASASIIGKPRTLTD